MTAPTELDERALVDALERIRDATPQSTNTVSAEGAFSFTRAVAATALDSLSAQCAQPQAGEVVGHRWRGPDGNWVCSWDRPLMEPTEYAEPLYASLQPANPAQVTDAMVKDATTEFLSHKGERPWRVTRRGAELWEDYAPAMRAALTAAIGAGGQAVAADIGDAVLGWMVKYDLLDGDNEYQVADVMAVMDDLVPSSALSQPHPADERVVEALRGAHDAFDTIAECAENCIHSPGQMTNYSTAKYGMALVSTALASLSQPAKGEREGEQEAVKDAGSKLAKAVWGIDLVQKGDKA